MSSRDLARRDIKTATKIQITIAAILLILSVVLIAGTTFARYESKNTSELTMDIQQSNQLFLLSGDTSESEEYDALSEWTRFSANEYVIDFLLANGNSNDNVCSYAQNAYLEMVVTAGAEKTENIQIVLTVGSDDYIAVATEIGKDTNLYTMYGPGWVYKFYNKAGEELSWELSGEKLNYQEMSLKVKNSSSYPVNVSLIATSTQAVN